MRPVMFHYLESVQGDKQDDLTGQKEKLPSYGEKAIIVTCMYKRESHNTYYNVTLTRFNRWGALRVFLNMYYLWPINQPS